MRLTHLHTLSEHMWSAKAASCTSFVALPVSYLQPLQLVTVLSPYPSILMSPNYHAQCHQSTEQVLISH